MVTNRWVAALIVAWMVAGCAEGSPAEKAVASFHGQPKDFYALDVESVRHPADLRKAALDHLGDADPDRHFAAFYALTLTAEPGASMAALDASLNSSDVTERLLAAGAVASGGGKEGLPVLIDALGQDTVVERLDPPMPAWAYAGFILTTVTDQDLGLRHADTAAAAAGARPAWDRWYREHEARLVWDQAQRRWSG